MRVIHMNKVSADNADMMSAWYSSRRRWMTSSCDMVWRATLSCLSCQSNAGYAEWSMRVIPTNSVSTDHADASSAVVKLAEEVDDVFL